MLMMGAWHAGRTDTILLTAVAGGGSCVCKDDALRALPRLSHWHSLTPPSWEAAFWLKYCEKSKRNKNS